VSMSMKLFNHFRDITLSPNMKILSLAVVVSCALPVGNVSWMLFQEGRSSNFRLRRGVGQAGHTRNNPHVKCTGVCCA
jgi:hypothetical protein